MKAIILVRGILQMAVSEAEGATGDTVGHLSGMSVEYLAASKKRLFEFFILGTPNLQPEIQSTRISKGDTKVLLFDKGWVRPQLKEECRELFLGAMECDEPTFGGRRKNKRGWGAAGKIIVFDILHEKAGGTNKFSSGETSVFGWGDAHSVVLLLDKRLLWSSAPRALKPQGGDSVDGFLDAGLVLG